MESTVQEEDITQAIETERNLKDNRDNVVSRHDVGRNNGFYPCRVTELKTIESERFNNLEPEDFDENHRVLRSGFDFMQNESLDKIEHCELSLPKVEEDVITIKYELVGADEKWEIREFWSLNDFPESQYLLTIPGSELGDMIGKVVPVIRQPTYGTDGKDREYIIASLAEKNLDRFPTHEGVREGVPQMTVHTDIFNLKMLTTCMLNFGLIGMAIGVFGHYYTGTALSVLVSLTIPFLLLRRSDWFYVRLYNIIGDAQLPSNPYHNQFESVSEFHKETKM